MLQLSERLEQLQASPIREILAVANRPGMVSFAGGLPAQDSFELPDFSAMPASYLQYGASEGEPALREQLCHELQQLGLACTPQQILVLSGSQQGIDLVAKLVIDAGTVVALEQPTYLAALQVFRFFGARFVAYERQRSGSLAHGSASPRLCYVVPTFQNPGGHCYSRSERMALAAACEQQDVLLFEDDPYRDLVYDACERQPVCSFMQQGSWVYQGSFSKSFAPGLRLGFLACSPDLITPLTRLKQAADLHSNRLAQYWILQQLQSPRRGARLAALQDQYRRKRDAFNAALERHFTGLASWQLPPGGLFFWLQLHMAVDTQQLLQRALAANVAFMPGEPFFALPPTDGVSHLRLNFSHADEAAMQQGLATLAALVRENTYA